MRGVRSFWLGATILGLLPLTPGSGAGRASAAMIEVVTDTSWRAVGAAPAAGWNTDPLFDASSWSAASVRRDRNLGGVTVKSIWAEPGANPVWLRKTFTLTAPIALATLYSVIDDDADIYLNGHLILSDHNGVMQYSAPLSVAEYLVVGTNLLAVNIIDNQRGTNGDFGARLVMSTVPEPASWLLLGIGGPLALGRSRRVWQRIARPL